jgi:hypothetical protein
MARKTIESHEFFCGECNKTFSGPESLKRHRKNVHEKYYPKIKIFTQEQAIKKFPKEHYENFDPYQFLIVGNKTEIQKAVSVTICIDGEQIPIGTVPKFEVSDRIGCGYQSQYLPKKGPIHIVVWGEQPKTDKTPISHTKFANRS